MYNIIKRILIAAAVFAVCACPRPSSANENISVYIDGNPMSFSRAPYTESDRTMVPMRSIFEYLGCAVDWDGGTQSVTAKKDGRVIIMMIDSPIMYTDGAGVELEVPPRLSGDTTFVPLRAVSEALDCGVTWSEDTNSVFIVTPARSEVPMYADHGSVPDFGMIAGVTPNPVLENGTIYCYENAAAEAETEYRKVMESLGFSVYDAGEYTIYSKDDISVLAGFRDGLFRVVITNY